MNKEILINEMFNKCSLKDGKRRTYYDSLDKKMKYFTHFVWNIYNPDDEIEFGSKNYVIHHKDEDSLNDIIDNLIKLLRKEHGIIHGTGNKNAMFGKEITDNHRKNLSLSRRGNKNPMYGRSGIDSPHFNIKWSEDRRKKHSLLIKEWHRKRKLVEK